MFTTPKFPHPMSSFFSRPVWKPSLYLPENHIKPGTLVAFSISTRGIAERLMNPHAERARHSLGALRPNVYLGIVNSSVMHAPLSEAESRANGGHGRIDIQIAPIGLTPPTPALLKASDPTNPQFLENIVFEELRAPLYPNDYEDAYDTSVEHATVEAATSLVDDDDEDEEDERAASSCSSTFRPLTPPKRKALRPSRPFPFRNAHVYTAYNVNGVVGRVHTKRPQLDQRCIDEEAWTLDKKELQRFDYMAFQDDWGLFAETYDKSCRHPRRPGDKSHGECSQHSCACHLSTGRTEYARGTEIASDQLVLDIWLDLEVVNEIADPHEFHKEWVHLNSIVRTSFWLSPPNAAEDHIPPPEPASDIELLAEKWSKLGGGTQLIISALIGVGVCGASLLGSLVL